MARQAYHNAEPALKVADNVPVETVKAEFARRLNKYMVKKGWNQSELARQAEAHSKGRRFGRDNVSVYIRGKVLPGPTHLDALCKAFGIKPEDLLPKRVAREAGEKYPSLDMRQLSDGRVWLRINQAVPFETALEIMRVIRDAPAE